MAGGLLYTSFQFGAALGLSAVTAVNISATDGTSPAALLDGYRAALVVPLAAALVAAAVSAFGLRARRTRAGSAPGGGHGAGSDRSSAPGGVEQPAGPGS